MADQNIILTGLAFNILGAIIFSAPLFIKVPSEKKVQAAGLAVMAVGFAVQFYAYL
ncbi:MAG: hypothetical protein J4224_04650 [Candidatus Diapherotrites archaeon]|uniref:Uncharacterized protein n=1 Tax=Candidatus Iainarchaeum sp. TaxID=3101447 RepID=A0A7J4IVH4_9ARCH|nr:MAG: hypothetical protein QT03_C0001G0034 [archaeon GW2011_AR10]MBS3059684.1 hypothetical protein [Candidatus Diapherotrites archaeon]HIH08245.1 hypothetical protein [Candidatus Diapherotrites archaeon]